MEGRFPAAAYHVPFFDEQDFTRKLCPKCGGYFWTQYAEMETCGEATPEGCAQSTFINDPPTRRSYTIREMRESFLSFFEKRGHTRLAPYPVVARWRDDLYLTNASIVDFQPYVTNGVVPPPANPLVISQPCIRLVDINKTGPTFGRHLTIFEMGGHHAFNYPHKEIYWKDETVRYHHEFATEELGISSEEVVYKEDVWSGGGNAGPSLETIVRGLELATLVFMKFRTANGKLIELPIRTVDTGYGVERFTWISQGTISGFHAIYGEILRKIFTTAGLTQIDDKLLAEVAKLSGTFNVEKPSKRTASLSKLADRLGLDLPQLNETLKPVENAFAVLDHTKTVAFLLAEGVVPSNVQEGYLTRLLIRRSYRLLEALNIETSLGDIIDLQISEWSLDFPYIKEMRDEILKILQVERMKFEQTLKRGKAMVSRISQKLKSKGEAQFPLEEMLKLYDSHGLPPEAVRDTAAEEDVAVRIPEDFYKMIAQRHLEAPPQLTADDEEPSHDGELPETTPLYYKDAYLARFKSRVVEVLDNNKIILDQTAFYPEGGGQPADKGVLRFNDKWTEVVDVQKIGRAIAHTVKDSVPREGEEVIGEIDWDRRSYHMRAHTATHLIMGAARRTLGQHVWQTGTQKNVEQTRLDISHHQRLTAEETRKIETLANQVVINSIPVQIEWLPRDEAEAKHGFRLYQGGAVPGKEIRVVKIGDWETEACAGTHVKNTGEIGFIKILRTERIQDGVERLVYSTGRFAVEATQQREELLRKLSEAMDAPLDKLLPTAKRLLKDWKKVRREKDKLQKLLTKRGTMTLRPERVSGFEVFAGIVDWVTDEQGLASASREFLGTGPNTIALVGAIINDKARVVISVGPDAIGVGLKANELAARLGAILGGGGSGTNDFAQAGGPLKGKLKDALEAGKKAIEERTA